MQDQTCYVILSPISFCRLPSSYYRLRLYKICSRPPNYSLRLLNYQWRMCYFQWRQEISALIKEKIISPRSLKVLPMKIKAASLERGGLPLVLTQYRFKQLKQRVSKDTNWLKSEQQSENSLEVLKKGTSSKSLDKKSSTMVLNLSQAISPLKICSLFEAMLYTYWQICISYWLESFRGQVRGTSLRKAILSAFLTTGQHKFSHSSFILIMGNMCNPEDSPLNKPVSIIRHQLVKESHYSHLLNSQVEECRSRLPFFYFTSERRGKQEGVLELQNGKGFYQGDLQGSCPQGNGCIYYANGQFFQGIFEKGLANAQGRYIFKDGSYFQGAFQRNKPLNGVYIDRQGNFQKGSVVENKLNGVGQQKKVSGQHYIGAFKLGVKQGKGKLFWSEGVYDGQFKADTFQGYGVIKFKKGTQYAGQFHKGLYHGFGKFSWPDGRVFEGFYEKGKMCGEGKASSKSSVFKGQWKDGKREGKGQFEQGGQKIVGLWHEDKLQNVEEQ